MDSFERTILILSHHITSLLLLAYRRMDYCPPANMHSLFTFFLFIQHRFSHCLQTKMIECFLIVVRIFGHWWYNGFLNFNLTFCFSHLLHVILEKQIIIFNEFSKPNCWFITIDRNWFHMKSRKRMRRTITKINMRINVQCSCNMMFPMKEIVWKATFGRFISYINGKLKKSHLDAALNASNWRLREIVKCMMKMDEKKFTQKHIRALVELETSKTYLLFYSHWCGQMIWVRWVLRLDSYAQQKKTFWKFNRMK